MAEAMPKVNAAPALAAPLALARQGYLRATQALAPYPVTETLSKLAAHPLVEQLNTKKELLLALLGLVLVFHGSQFTNLLLCTQVSLALLYDRVKGSIMTIYSDLQAAHEKMKADAPAEEPKDTSDEKSKHAKKREEKKQAAEKASWAEKQKDDVEAARKVLKVLDSERLSAAATEVLAAVMACLLVIHGGFAQKVVVAHALVKTLAERVECLLEFPGYEDLRSWTSILIRLTLWVLLLPLAVVAAPFALAMDASFCGAQLATEHGARFLAASGKVEDAEAFIASPRGLMAFGGLAAFGTLWQLWTWAAGGSIAWYFQLVYLPALVMEGLLSLL